MINMFSPIQFGSNFACKQVCNLRREEILTELSQIITLNKTHVYYLQSQNQDLQQLMNYLETQVIDNSPHQDGDLLSDVQLQFVDQMEEIHDLCSHIHEYLEEAKVLELKHRTQIRNGFFHRLLLQAQMSETRANDDQQYKNQGQTGHQGMQKGSEDNIQKSPKNKNFDRLIEKSEGSDS